MVYYIIVAKRNAAIAQSVERILGKDEVASSNLASSSKEKAHPSGWALSFMVGWKKDLKDQLQQSAGLLLAASVDGGNTVRCA